MTDAHKRKDGPAGPSQQKNKKKKTGNSGKWMTPHQKASIASAQSQSVQAGDAGIWVTCARNQEGKAIRELCTLFDEYVSLMYGIDKDEGDNDDGDLESAIKRQIDALKSKESNPDRVFRPLKMNVACLVFVKTKLPIEPVEFVRRICQDAKACTDVRNMKCRHINRFSPSSFGGKANEAAIADLARKALAPSFHLIGKTTGADEATASVDKVSDDASEIASNVVTSKVYEETGQAGGVVDRKDYSFAIRPTIRNNTSISRGRVIEIIANLINSEHHRVKLEAPDKVILVDIFQNVCGMSVVDGDWDDLKRYNITELYNESTGKNKNPKAS